MTYPAALPVPAGYSAVQPDQDHEDIRNAASRAEPVWSLRHEVASPTRSNVVGRLTEYTDGKLRDDEAATARKRRVGPDKELLGQRGTLVGEASVGGDHWPQLRLGRRQ